MSLLEDIEFKSLCFVNKIMDETLTFEFNIFRLEHNKNDWKIFYYKVMSKYFVNMPLRPNFRFNFYKKKIFKAMFVSVNVPKILH